MCHPPGGGGCLVWGVSAPGGVWSGGCVCYGGGACLVQVGVSGPKGVSALGGGCLVWGRGVCALGVCVLWGGGVCFPGGGIPTYTEADTPCEQNHIRLS